MNDIVAEIAAAIPQGQQGSQPWFVRVPEEHQATVRAIHEAWHAGLLGTRKKSAARVISAKLSTLGISIGEQGVIAWLRIPTY